MRSETMAMLRENSDNFQGLLENTGCGITLLSPAMEVLDLNAQMREWFPQVDETQESLCYRSFSDPPRDDICPGCPVAKTLADGLPHELAKNNTSRSFRIVSLPVWDGSGEIVAVLEFIENTTERRRSEEKVKQARNEFKQIFDAASDGMRVIGLDYSIRRVNRAYTRLAGAAEDELIGQKCYESFACVTRILNGEERFVIEMERQRPDGGRYWCLVGSAALRAPDDKLIGIVQNFMDISDRKLAERALQESERNLQKQKAELEKANIALKVLLSQIELERREVEEQVSANIMGLVEPHINKLKKSGLSQRQQVFVDMLETNLVDVVSPVVRTSVAMHLKFTPAEVQITRLVKQGKTSKEIAELLHLSPRTIEKHRRNIRKKSGITNKKINLKTILDSYI